MKRIYFPGFRGAKKGNNSKLHGRGHSGEVCVLCGQASGYYFDDPIDERQFYIEGAGQLCEKCWQEIFGRQSDHR